MSSVLCAENWPPRRLWSLTDVGTASIASLKYLRELCFRSVGGLTDDRFSVIASSCSNLEEVNLTNAPDISVESMRALTQGPASSRIKRFTVINGNVGDDALVELVKCTSLESIYLGSCHRLTDAASTSLGQMRGLRRLSIVNAANITDNVLRNVCENCLQLETLRLDLCPLVSSPGLAALVRLPRLQELSLSYCPEIALGAAHVIGRCRELRLCELTKTKVDDEALDVIVSGDAVAGRRLVTLDVRQCIVSRMAVCDAVAENPGLNVLSDYGIIPR